MKMNAKVGASDRFLTLKSNVGNKKLIQLDNDSKNKTYFLYD